MKQLAADLQAGAAVEDERFDRFLAPAWQKVSAVHWTPLEVCRQVIRLLAPRPGESVLDVGSGVGKLCIAGALMAPATFVGIEQRPQLVLQAQAVAQRAGVSNVLFACRDALAEEWRGFHCLYLYNPFGELHLEAERRVDAAPWLHGAGYRAHVKATRRKLGEMPAGTRVVTFHGFGGDMPEAYDVVSVESIAGGMLALWVKEA
jgi:SAM-dependent methyltransferase